MEIFNTPAFEVNTYGVRPAGGILDDILRSKVPTTKPELVNWLTSFKPYKNIMPDYAQMVDPLHRVFAAPGEIRINKTYIDNLLKMSRNLAEFGSVRSWSPDAPTTLEFTRDGNFVNARLHQPHLGKEDVVWYESFRIPEHIGRETEGYVAIYAAYRTLLKMDKIFRRRIPFTLVYPEWDMDLIRAPVFLPPLRRWRGRIMRYEFNTIEPENFYKTG